MKWYFAEDIFYYTKTKSCPILGAEHDDTIPKESTAYADSGHTK